MWPFSKRKRRPEKLHVHEVSFIGEQDGPSERDLKRDLRQIFAQHRTVERAYLAIAHYGDPNARAVVLCIAGTEDLVVVKHVQQTFAKMFAVHASLDTMFVDDQKEARVAAVCEPFYHRAR